MSAPGSLIRAQISTQRLLPPGNLRRCDDGSECGRGLEPARKTERNREGAMPAHRMAEHRLAIQLGRKIRPYETAQSLRHIRPHPVMLRDRRLGGLDIAARPQAEVVGYNTNRN